MHKKYAIVIPARYKSSRFPGKPLADINGKTMIQHVWEKCTQAEDKSLVYIATDDDRIEEVVTGFGGQVIRTSPDCLTGTDRVAEANLQLEKDFIINVQGDEPMINPDDIVRVRERYLQKPDFVINAYTRIQSEDVFSTTIPKVVVSKTGNLLYMSRSALPMSKNGNVCLSYKQVCIYAFSKEHLHFFLSHQEKTPLEYIEDIEILRFLENDINVNMVEVDNSSMAVDTPEDLEGVRLLMSTR
ncbi:3-deoxy-manno-octulosonate cytidylyltransferase [Salinisphaera sp. G21_0]|uniref:3-deoxy-manno-octulosonate cytidylyltransferase n=1 Tax=Salinisphaera sp. G21_0 TaxID=2821094 RepID=UPI001ADCA62B|nr:3-deoxy-manno-octulosonate cytidylyltransferase [Salinisphaera sp. G21_0]MBO9484364.1 3-deoxy-manno-octulosonate cytidylyltransferase [Salinisphaera sp. G21_0]